MVPAFPIKLLLIILLFVLIGGIGAYVGTRGANSFKKQGVAWGLTALMIIAAIGIGYARAPVNDPTPEPDLPQGSATFPSYVRDEAGVLSDKTERALYERNLRLYGNYGVVIGVVTCNYGGEDLYDYALNRAENMDLRDSDFIVVLDIRGDNYWLVQGVDLVDDFTDDDCGRYARNYMEDAFAAGDYDRAVLDLTEMLESWYGSYFG